jgi:molecular chaperone GrpE
MNPKSQNPPVTAPGVDATVAEAPATEVDSLRAELAEQKNLNLRLTADFANFRRRTRQDAESRALAQKELFIRELLPVLDNLERALASGTSPGAPQLRQGVEMTMQQLQQLLRQHGIETQESAGQPFDPHLHEAVSQGHDPAQPDHAIIEVLQRGYRRGEKVFRPAKVVVNERVAR